MLTLTSASALHTPLVLPLTPAPWWELFDVTREEIRAVASHIVRLYDHTQARTAQGSGLGARVQEKHGGLIELATKSRIRLWLSRTESAAP